MNIQSLYYDFVELEMHFLICTTFSFFSEVKELCISFCLIRKKLSLLHPQFLIAQVAPRCQLDVPPHISPGPLHPTRTPVLQASSTSLSWVSFPHLPCGNVFGPWMESPVSCNSWLLSRFPLVWWNKPSSSFWEIMHQNEPFEHTKDTLISTLRAVKMTRSWFPGRK